MQERKSNGAGAQREHEIGAQILNDALTSVARIEESEQEWVSASATLMAVRDLLLNDHVREGMSTLYPDPKIRVAREREFVNTRIYVHELEARA